MACASAPIACSFTPDDATVFPQQPVPPVTITIDAERSIGSAFAGTPRCALAWQLYFAEPTGQVLVSLDRVDSFPSEVTARLDELLPASRLNRGFALGYGNYVLGAAFFVMYADLNDNGAWDKDEPLIGSSAQHLLVYIQGAPSQEVIDQFGALQQGYNLCVRTAQIGGVDLFQTVAPATQPAVVVVPKEGTPVRLPRLR